MQSQKGSRKLLFHTRILSLELPKISGRGDKTRLKAELTKQLKSRKRQGNRLKQFGRDLLREKNSLHHSKFPFRDKNLRKAVNRSFRHEVSRDRSRALEEASSFKKSNESFYNSQKRRTNKETKNRVRKCNQLLERSLPSKSRETKKKQQLHKVIENDDEILVDRSQSGNSVMVSRSKSQGDLRKEKLRMRIKRGKNFDKESLKVISRKVSIHDQAKNKVTKKGKIESCRDTGRLESGSKLPESIAVRSERQVKRVDQTSTTSQKTSKIIKQMKKSIHQERKKSKFIGENDSRKEVQNRSKYGYVTHKLKKLKKIPRVSNVSEKTSGFHKPKSSGMSSGGHGMKRSLGMKHLEINLQKLNPQKESTHKSSRRRSKSNENSYQTNQETQRSQNSSEKKYFTLTDKTLEQMEAQIDDEAWNNQRQEEEELDHNFLLPSQNTDISASLNVSRHRVTLKQDEIIRRNSALDTHSFPFQKTNSPKTKNNETMTLPPPKPKNKMAASLAHMTNFGKQTGKFVNDFSRNQIEKNYSMFEGGERGLMGAEHTPRISGLEAIRNIYMGGKRDRVRRIEDTKRRSQMNSKEKRHKWTNRGAIRHHLPGKAAFMKKNLTKKNFDLLTGKGMIKDKPWKRIYRRDVTKKVAKESEKAKFEYQKIVKNFNGRLQKEGISKSKREHEIKESTKKQISEVKDIQIHFGDLQTPKFQSIEEDNETANQDPIFDPKEKGNLAEKNQLSLRNSKGTQRQKNRDSKSKKDSKESNSRTASSKKIQKNSKKLETKIGTKFLKKKRGKASAKREAKGLSTNPRREGISRGLTNKQKTTKCKKRKSDWDSAGHKNHFTPKYGLQGIPSPNIAMRDHFSRKRIPKQGQFKDIVSNLNEQLEKKFSIKNTKTGGRAHNYWKNMDPLSKLKNTTRGKTSKLPLKLGTKTKTDKRDRDLITQRAEKRMNRETDQPIKSPMVKKNQKFDPFNPKFFEGAQTLTSNRHKNIENLNQKQSKAHGKTNSRNKIEQGHVEKLNQKVDLENNFEYNDQFETPEQKRKRIRKNKSKTKLNRMLTNKNALKKTKKDIYTQVRGMRKTGQEGNEERIREREEDIKKHLKNFQIIQFLGKGSYAEVKMAFDLGKSLYQIFFGKNNINLANF